MQLDATDKKILFELDRNCRRTNTDIARRLRINKSIVNYRIKNMLKNGIIEGFFTVIDTTRLGYQGYKGYFKWHLVNPELEKKMINFLVRNHCVWWAGSIDGEWDLGFVLWTKNIYELRDFWISFMSIYQRHVNRYILTPYTRAYDHSYGFLNGERKIISQIGSNQGKVHINAKAENILRILGAKARLSETEIARATGYTPGIVRYQIQKLVRDGVIKGFRAKINSEKIGYCLYKLNLKLKDREKYEEMVQYANAHPNIVYMDETVVFADFEVEILVANHIDFQNILKEMRSLFGDEIREVNYFIYSKIHKIVYFQ
ncbi:MAG: winged helix-turn-helix transcriptional regulator [Candidatus Aenigmatarchaeota archaeon]